MSLQALDGCPGGGGWQEGVMIGVLGQKTGMWALILAWPLPVSGVPGEPCHLYSLVFPSAQYRVVLPAGPPSSGELCLSG